MKKLTYLSLLLMLVLVLTACGPADTEPGEGATGIGTPDEFGTPVNPLDTPVVPITPETTPELTPEETQEVTPPAPPETTPTEGTPDAGDTSDESPTRARNMLDFDVRNYEDETIGSVEELVVSLGSIPGQADQQATPSSEEDQQEGASTSPDDSMGDGGHISFVIVNVGGFLGIGQRQVAIPYEALQVQTGEDETDYAFYIDIGEEELETLPVVNLDDLDFTHQDWDLNLRTGWEGEATIADLETTPTVEDVTPTPDDSSAIVETPTDTEQAGMQIHALRLSVLLGSEVYDQVAVVPGQTSRTTPSPAADETPTTATQETPDTAGTVLDIETVVGTVEDLIVNPDTGEVEYIVLYADENLRLGERWIPVPLSALNIMGADDLLLGMGIEYFVKIDRQQLVDAPNFEVGTLPVAEDPDWDIGVRDYWGIQ